MRVVAVVVRILLKGQLELDATKVKNESTTDATTMKMSFFKMHQKGEKKQIQGHMLFDFFEGRVKRWLSSFGVLLPSPCGLLLWGP